ncbi:hypothetical protein C816_03195 [Oscillibacter sp. 1-3]|nr:hypothetical protein C816_03195 [Oscillibacter sp. 1-3]
MAGIIGPVRINQIKRLSGKIYMESRIFVLFEQTLEQSPKY